MTISERFQVLVVKNCGSFVSFDVDVRGDSAPTRFDDARRAAGRRIGEWLDRDSLMLREYPAAVFIGNDQTRAVQFRLQVMPLRKPTAAHYELIAQRTEDNA